MLQNGGNRDFLIKNNQCNLANGIILKNIF